MGNTSRVEESQEGIDEEVEQEGGTLYRSRVQLDCCGGLTTNLNSHRRLFINAAGQGEEKKCCVLESKWKIKYDLLRN